MATNKVWIIKRGCDAIAFVDILSVDYLGNMKAKKTKGYALLNSSCSNHVYNGKEPKKQLPLKIFQESEDCLSGGKEEIGRWFKSDTARLCNDLRGLISKICLQEILMVGYAR